MGAGAIDIVVKMVAYFVHERIWNLIPFGRERRVSASLPEYEI